MSKNREHGRSLNETFEDAFPGAREIFETFSEAGKLNLSLSVSLHEFGHALGLRHEDAHPDATCEDYRETLGGGRVISDYNPFSFMRRCHYRTYNYELGVLKPNARDIDGINSMYDSAN